MVYSVNSYSTLSTSKAVFGLASGLDTDELIGQMTAGIKSKIATQLQNKQLALWKQTAYREISSKMIAFNNKYFSAGSSDSILSSNFYNVSSISNSSPYVSVSGNADVAQNMIIRDIASLAEKTSFTSAVSSDTSVTTGEILSNWQVNYLQGAKFSFSYGGTDYCLTMDENFEFGSAEDAEGKLDAVINALNAQIDADEALSGKLSFSKADDGNGGYTVSITDLTGNNEEIKIKKDGSGILLAGLGLTPEQTSSEGVLTGESGADVTQFYEEKALSGVLAGNTLTVSLNGVSKTIAFDANEQEQYQVRKA
jgi:hypothetical protein